MAETLRWQAFACALGACVLVTIPTASLMHFPTAIVMASVLFAVAWYALEQRSKVMMLRERLMKAEATEPRTGVLTGEAFIEASGGVMNARVVSVSLEDLEEIEASYGWETKQAVLSHVANVICATVREDDPVGRTDGDTFSVLLADVDADIAQRICARLEAKIAAAPFSNNKAIIELFAHARAERVRQREAA